MARRGSRKARIEKREAYADRKKAVQPAPSTPARRKSPPKLEKQSRGTFDVTRANKAIARELPQIIKQPDRNNYAKAAIDPAPQGQRIEEAARAPKPVPVAETNLTVGPRLCKAKPSNTKGNGSSRSFVPWCK